MGLMLFMLFEFLDICLTENQEKNVRGSPNNPPKYRGFDNFFRVLVQFVQIQTFFGTFHNREVNQEMSDFPTKLF